MSVRCWSSGAFAATVVVLIQLVTTTAAAEVLTVCQFTARCDVYLDTSQHQDCGASDLIFSIRSEAGNYLLDTPGLDFPAELSVDEANGARSFRTRMERSATHMLTIFADGTAFLSTHTQLSSTSEDESVAVNVLASNAAFIGSCEP